MNGRVNAEIGEGEGSERVGDGGGRGTRGWRGGEKSLNSNWSILD